MEPQDDLDKEKVRMFWDYHKTRIYTSLTMTISAFVAIFVILNAINLAGKVPSAVHPRFRTPWITTIVFGAFAAIMPAFLNIDVLSELVNIGTLLAFTIVCAGVLVKDKKLVIETDALMRKLAKHEPIPPLKELLKVEEPTTFWEEYRKAFGVTRKTIILLTVVLIVLLLLGLFI